MNATPESARIMMEVIRDMGVEKTVGFKPAGGVRTAEDAQKYLAIADELFGADWLMRVTTALVLPACWQAC